MPAHRDRVDALRSATPDLVDLDERYTRVNAYEQFNPLAVTYFKCALFMTLLAGGPTRFALSRLPWVLSNTESALATHLHRWRILAHFAFPCLPMKTSQ